MVIVIIGALLVIVGAGAVVYGLREADKARKVIADSVAHADREKKLRAAMLRDIDQIYRFMDANPVPWREDYVPNWYNVQEGLKKIVGAQKEATRLIKMSEEKDR